MNSSDQPLVIITHQVPEAWIKDLRNSCRVILGPEGGQGISADLQPYLKDARGLISLLDDPITPDVIEQAASLQVISNLAVGTDNIAIQACTERGIPVGNTPGVLTAGTADLAVALLLAAARQLPQASRDAREGRWSTWDPTGWLGSDLKDAVVGIVGLGKIGTAVARRLKAFEARILFTNRSEKPELERELGAVQVSLTELLEKSDFVCLHVPLTPETRNLIDRSALKRMKSTAILVNAARGPVVDTQALVEALQQNWIRAAGLDVTDPEPLPPDHELYQLENCLVTPHIGSATFNTRHSMADLAVQNILAGLRDEMLPHCVNPEVYQQQ